MTSRTPAQPKQGQTPQVSTILIADPDPSVRRNVRAILDETAFALREAASAEAAVGQVETRQFDVILLGETLAKRNSYSVLQSLRPNPHTTDTAIILLANSTDPSSTAIFFEHGADDYIPLPLLPILLLPRINAATLKNTLTQRIKYFQHLVASERARTEKLLDVIIPISISLSSEQDFNRILEMILLESKALCNADGGTVYLLTKNDTLAFEIVMNDSLNVYMGGTTDRPITFQPLPLHDAKTGAPNHRNIATYTALTGETVSIPDAYKAEGFDFAGTRAFDALTGYRSKSFMTVPLKQQGTVIGVLQLINAQNEVGEIIPFETDLQKLVLSLSDLASVTLQGYIREQKLQEQIQVLQFEIDKAKKAEKVTEISDSEYFQSLKTQVKHLRRSPKSKDN